MSLTALAVMAPLIIKTSVTGFTPVEWSRSEKCEVFDGEIIQTRTYAGKQIQFQFPYTTQDSIQYFVEKAAEEKMKSENNYMCDGPSTMIKATYQKDGIEQELLLYSTGGCGSPKKHRMGPYSSALIDIASTFCPTTH